MKDIIIKIKVKLYWIYTRIKMNMHYFIHYKIRNLKFNIEDVDKILFIAHPDDEVVFFSQQLISKDGWLVVCITNGGNKIRSREFINSMNKFNARYKILNFEDGYMVKWNEKKVINKINKILNMRKEWDIIVTHNYEGEYGHFQHKELNRIIKSICNDRKVYITSLNGGLEVEKNKLSLKKKLQKEKLMKELYKSQKFVIYPLHKYFIYEGIEESC